MLRHELATHILDLASDFTPLLIRQAVHCRLQLLCHLLTVSLGEAVYNAALHPAHAVHKLFTDQAGDVLHAISKLSLLLPHLIPATQGSLMLDMMVSFSCEPSLAIPDMLFGLGTLLSHG